MNRRSFLGLLGGLGAASATSYFFAPVGGWKSDVIAQPEWQHFSVKLPNGVGRMDASHFGLKTPWERMVAKGDIVAQRPGREDVIDIWAPDFKYKGCIPARFAKGGIYAIGDQSQQQELLALEMASRT